MGDTTVKVAIRVRPQLAREVLDMCQVCSHVVPGEPQIVLGNDKSFTFDHVLVSNSSQKEVYEACCSDLIEGTFEGYNATILAYGQTGSGKTYTMGTGFDVDVTEDQVGIIPRAVQHLFNGIEQRKNEAISNTLSPPDFKVHAQFMELYNEEINDLLDSTRDTTERCKKSLIRIHEDASGGIYTVGATTRLVSSLEDTMECLQIGAMLRSTGSTQMNVQSSRSHAIFTLHIKQLRVCKENTSENCSETEVLSAKFHFVDLAGSERLKRTGATGERAKEGISINCGLLALGNVISALGDRAKKGMHVPYRDSKLTRLLQDSLGGNSQTLMIACISPSDRDFVETLNTLKYANRARNIKNKVSINQDMSSKQLSALRAEIQTLQQELMEYKLGRKSMESSSSSVSMLQSSDITLENQLLSKEIEGLRQRVKGLQQTVEGLRVRNIELMRDRDVDHLSRKNVEGTFDEELKKKIEGYIKEAEDFRVKFMESESNLEVLKLSHNKLLRSPVDVRAFKMSPDDHINEILSFAQKDLDSLKNKYRLKSLSQEGDAVTGEEDNENEESEMAEEELKESDEDLSENEVQSHSLTNLDSNIAQLVSEISVKEKLMEELKLSQVKMKIIQAQYEEKMKNLEEKIKEMLQERDQVIANLENVESNSEEKSKKIREEYERKLTEMQSELKKLESANRSHMKMLKEHSMIEKQCKTMQQELLEMKKQKVQLMNKIKEDVQRNRQLELRRDKEIHQLKKSQRMKDNQIKTMEAERKQKDIVLKRKQEEVESLRKRNRPILSAKASTQMVKNEKESSESIRPKRPTKFPDKSSKSIWNNIEKMISSLVSKKQMLNGLEKDMDRWIKQRNRLGKKLEALQKKQKECKHDEEVLINIQTIEDNISYIQENIVTCQNNIMQLEEVKDEDPMKKLYGCSSAKLKYLLEYSINSIISKDLALIEKEAKNMELSAKLHQQKMDSTYQRDMLQILIQDKENIEIDGSLLSARQDSDDEEIDIEDEEHNNDHLKNDVEPITSSTPIRCSENFSTSSQMEVLKTFGTYESPTLEGPLIVKKEKARRKTATPGELLFVGHGNPTFGVISEIPSVDNSKEDSSETAIKKSQNLNDDHNVIPPFQKSAANRLTNVLSRLNENSNNRQFSNRQPLSNDYQHVPRKKPLSASSSLGSDSISKAGSVVSTNTEATPPASPGTSRRTGTSNVFSRLYTRHQFNSPFPPKGVIRSYSSKSSDNFPLTHCHSAFGHTKAVLSIHATDSLLFSGSKDRTAKMWDLESGEELMSMGVHMNNVVSIKYSESSGLVYTASTYLIKLWDPRQGGVCIKSLTSAGHTCDGISGTNGPISRLHTCPQGETNIIDICISTSGNHLYSAVGNYVKIWDMRMCKVVGKLSGGHQAAVMALAIDDTDTADGNTCIVTGSKDHYIKVYEIMEDMTGPVSPKYNLEPPHYDGIQSLCLKGDFLFSGSRDTCIKKWDLAGQQLKQSINNAHKDWICGLTFLPSSNCLLSACRAGVMKVWNVDNCILIGETQAHSSPINAITSNSQFIFSASNDKSIQFWKCKNNADPFEGESEF